MENLDDDAAKLDRQVLDFLRGHEGQEAGSLLAEVIDVFLPESQALMEAMAHGIGENDVEKIGFAAHSLKSSSASVGAIEMAAIADRLELACAESSPVIADLSAMHAQLKIESEWVSNFLINERKGLT